MTTRAPKHARSTRYAWSTAAALSFAVSAGCAHAPPQPPPQPILPSDHTVRIVFTGNCPVDVQPQEAPCDKVSKPQCFHARNSETVLFQAWSGDGPVAQEFELQFDPFKKAPLRAGSGQLQLRIDVKVASPKEFRYNVLSGACNPIDPQIIVDQ